MASFKTRATNNLCGNLALKRRQENVVSFDLNYAVGKVGGSVFREKCELY